MAGGSPEHWFAGKTPYAEPAVKVLRCVSLIGRTEMVRKVRLLGLMAQFPL